MLSTTHCLLCGTLVFRYWNESFVETSPRQHRVGLLRSGHRVVCPRYVVIVFTPTRQRQLGSPSPALPSLLSLIILPLLSSLSLSLPSSLTFSVRGSPQGAPGWITLYCMPYRITCLPVIRLARAGVQMDML